MVLNFALRFEHARERSNVSQLCVIVSLCQSTGSNLKFTPFRHFYSIMKQRNFAVPPMFVSTLKTFSTSFLIETACINESSVALPLQRAE